MQAKELAEEVSKQAEEHNLSSTQRLSAERRQWQQQEEQLQSQLLALARNLADAKQNASDQLEASERWVI